MVSVNMQHISAYRLPIFTAAVATHTGVETDRAWMSKGLVHTAGSPEAAEGTGPPTSASAGWKARSEAHVASTDRAGIADHLRMGPLNKEMQRMAPVKGVFH